MCIPRGVFDAEYSEEISKKYCRKIFKKGIDISLES